MKQLIDRLKYLTKAATSGPWEAQANAGYCGIMAGGNPLFLADGATVADGQAACFLRNHAPALLDEIDRLTARVAELEDCRRTCAWRECDDFEAPGTYLTACGHYWSFTEGDRKDNSAAYCPYCGGKIEEDES